MSTPYLVAASDDGFTLFGVWYTDPSVEDVLYISAGNSRVGLRFVGFPVTTATRIRPPSPIYTSQLTLLGVTLRLHKQGTEAGTTTVRLTSVVAPAPWSTVNPPDDTGTVVGSLVDPGTPGTKLIPLDLTTLTHRYRRNDWPGALAFALSWTPNPTLTVSYDSREYADKQGDPSLAPALLVDAVGEMSGTQGHVHAQSRVDRCPRCSRPSLRETWVVDGYSKTYVCKECYDPADPLWTRRVPRPITPGINDAG